LARSTKLECGETAPFASPLDRGRRIVLAAVAYLVFGVGALFLAALVLPATRRRHHDPDAAERAVQRRLHRALRGYLRWLERCDLLRVRAPGGEALARPGRLVVANHPTGLDALAFVALMPQVDLIVKESHLRNPFLGSVARAAGYAPNAGGVTVVEACVQRLLRGRSVLVFPEGTRSPRGGLAPFQRGAAHIALRSGCDLLPVTIRCKPEVVVRDRGWWQLPDCAIDLQLDVGAPLAVEDLAGGESTPGRAARAVTGALRTHFESGSRRV